MQNPLPHRDSSGAPSAVAVLSSRGNDKDGIIGHLWKHSNEHAGIPCFAGEQTYAADPF